MIKVGDWVTYKSTGEIARVRVVDNDRYINGVCIDDCIKLPIKFKGFEFNEALFNGKPRWRYTEVNNKIGRTVFQYGLTKQGRYIATYCNLKLGSCGQSFHTIEEAKDWLELQYATMIAKERRLI